MEQKKKEPDLMECQLVMISYKKLLKQVIGEYAPTDIEEPLPERFCAAIKSYNKSKEMLNMLLSPNPEDKQEAVATLCEDNRIEKIKQYIIKKGGAAMWEKR